MAGHDDKAAPRETSFVNEGWTLCLVIRFGGFWMGVIICQFGSPGLEATDETGDSSTSVEPSHVEPMRGEYAGVEGSESMKVPNDCADMGGDIGDRGNIGDRGVRGSLGRGDDGRPIPGKGGERLLLVESAPGDLGGPWVDGGGNSEFPL